MPLSISASPLRLRLLLFALWAPLWAEAAASAVWRRSKAPEGETWLAAEVAASGQVLLRQQDRFSAAALSSAADVSADKSADPSGWKRIGDTHSRGAASRIHASDFCAPQLQGYEGTRGVPPPVPGLRLRQAQIITRHGTRSPLHQLPGHSNEHVYSCELTPENEERVSEWEERLLVIDLDKVPHENRGYQPLRPLSDANGECFPGQLTNVGIDEMHDLGEYLRDAYAGPLNLTQKDRTSVFAVATNTTRTVMSAAAILGAVMRDHPQQSKVATIWADESCGYYPSFSGSCPRAERLYYQAEAETWERRIPRTEMRHQLREIFDIQEGDSAEFVLNPRAVTDNVLMSLCNGGPVPCGPTGLCLSQYLIGQLADAADEEWCHAYKSSAAGSMSSHLSVLPVLTEIAERMKDAIDGDGPNFVVLSGHDTTFAALGSTFGFWDCTWPPIRSRASFELWTMEDPAERTQENSYVRHLVNGVPVTDDIDRCPPGQEYCPFDLFFASIQKLQFGYKSVQEACH